MNILVIGSGGREHALVAKLRQCGAGRIYVAPGNGGTDGIADNVAELSPDNITALVEFAKNNNIDLVVPGPELPLTLGVVDAMQTAGIACFGPDSYCAQLEGSKKFAKEIMACAGVPTAKCDVFKDIESAREFVRRSSGPVVVKADGLAAGKGVVVAKDKAEALQAVEEMLGRNRFGVAGSTILIEEKLEGEEVSLLCFCDGETALPLPSAQDHKAVFDGDQGPNTGGMGAYSPAPCLPDEKLEEMADIVIRPVLAEMTRRGHPFKGILYAGLMLTRNGPKVLEYNVRFGDPECQPLLMRMESNLLSHLRACINGTLKDEKPVFRAGPAVGIVLAAGGYPGDYAKNCSISGIDQAEADENVKVFHSGTKKDGERLYSSGGRVLCVTALGDNLTDARARAYSALEKIEMPQSHYRKDIGAKGIRHLEKNSI